MYDDGPCILVHAVVVDCVEGDSVPCVISANSSVKRVVCGKDKLSLVYAIDVALVRF